MRFEKFKLYPFRFLAGALLACLSFAYLSGCEVFFDAGAKKEAPAVKAAEEAPDKTPEKAPEKEAKPAGQAKAAPQSWPTWGGQPSRNMVNSFATGIVSEWDVESGKNIKWKAALGSQSYGNPTIADGRIFVGTNNEGKRNPDIEGDKGIIMCFTAGKGEFLWQAVHDKLTQGRVNDWPEQGICSSPAIEGDLIYYISNRCELVCADVNGFRDGENDGPYKDEKYTS